VDGFEKKEIEGAMLVGFLIGKKKKGNPKGKKSSRSSGAKSRGNLFYTPASF